MLTLIHNVAGRIWAIDGELAANVQGLLDREGLAALRHLAGLKAEVHAFDYDKRQERLEARRGGLSPAVGSIAIVPIIGVLTPRGEIVASAMTRSTDDLAAEVQTMAAQPEVAAVVLDVDSPGGDVSKVTEAFSAIRAAAKAKPIVASVNARAASAAYWLACAADEIWVTPSGRAGGIGVYSMHVDESKANETAGKAYTFVSAGKYKIEGSPTGPLDAEARSYLQAAVDDSYGMFVKDVAKGRGVSAEAVRNGFGEGRMVGAKAAVEQGMATGVGTIEDVIRRAAALAKERRAGMPAPASRAAAHAGPMEAPNLGAADNTRGCMNCTYYRKPTENHDGGVCARHDFHTMDMWACDDWESNGKPMEPMKEEPGMASTQRAALDMLRTL